MALAPSQPEWPETHTARVSYLDHRLTINRYFRAHLHDANAADDLTQDVFAAALPGLAKASADARPILPWLLKIAERRLADAQRARARERAHLVPLEPCSEQLRQPRDDPRLVSSGLIQTLHDAIDALPASQRAVLTGHLLEGRTFSELAARLDTTEAACKTRFARAIAAAQHALRDAGHTR